jgi:HD-GYP domain-containing protein (c-di-GMP phosphodiesterase class II)
MSEYAGHLANMQDKAKIVATEDILSDKGVLLAKGGIELNKKVCDNILKFKLLKPIEDSIAIENQLNAKSVYNILCQLIAQDTWLKGIHSQLGDKVALQRCCLRLEKFPILLQKLTVLKMALFHVFEQAVFSAYLSYICALTEQLEQTKIEEYFLAGMMHDIGLLHIDHNILKKDGQLTPEEWRNIQSHPIIGYEIVKNIKQFPKRVARAILEHHENMDGSGYPRKKRGEELCDLGQIINLLDNTIAIYNKKLKQQKRSIRGVIPVIQINIHSYSHHVAGMIIRALKHAPESIPAPDKASELNDLINNTQKRQRYIQKTTVIINNANQELGYSHNDTDVIAIQNTGNNIILIVNSSGLNDTQYTDSLSEMAKTEPENMVNEVEDAHIMLGEVIYQIQTYQKNANLFVSHHVNHPLTPTLSKCLEDVAQVPTPDKTGSFKRESLG